MLLKERLRESIKEVYSSEYNVEEGIDLEFDQIFLPSVIAQHLIDHKYYPNSNLKQVHTGANILGKKILDYKKANKGKKDFSMLFAKDFLLIKLLEITEKEKYFREYVPLNIKRLGVSRYDIGHELSEQDKKAFRSNFLNKARDDLERLVKEDKTIKGRIQDEEISGNTYALTVLAGTYLELSFTKFDELQHPLQEVKKNMKQAISLVEESIIINNSMQTDDREYRQTRNFQIFFAERFYNFVAYTKRYIEVMDKEFYKFLAIKEREIFLDLDLKYPSKPRRQRVLTS